MSIKRGYEITCDLCGLRFFVEDEDSIFELPDGWININSGLVDFYNNRSFLCPACAQKYKSMLKQLFAGDRSVNEADPIEFLAAADKYCDSCKFNLTEKTLRYYELVLRNYRLAAHKEGWNIQNFQADLYAAFLTRKKYAAKTTSNRLSIVRNFYRWTTEKGMIIKGAFSEVPA